MFFRSARDTHGEKRPLPDTTPDTMFPHLPRYLADTLREEAIRELQHLGYRTSWRPDGYIAASRGNTTRIIGLDNLSLQISKFDPAPSREDIAAQAHRHFDALSHDVNPDTIPEADFLRQLKVRLVSRKMLESFPGPTSGTSRTGGPDGSDATSTHEDQSQRFDLTTRPWTDNLAISLVLDTPTTVMTLADETLHARGIDTPSDLKDLWHAGYRNLWQELVDAEISVNEIQGDDPGASFYAIESDSFFLASAAFFLDDLLPHWTSDLNISEGLILAVPHRHLLLLRAVTGGQDLLAGINAITSVTIAQFSENPGPVSPQLHLVREGSEILPFTNISHNEAGERVIEVHPDDFLMDRLNEGRDSDDPDTI